MKLISILCFIFLAETMNAQDPIFTQNFMVPETLNPGFTGFSETTNAGVLHRSQWPSSNFKVDSEFAFINTWNESMNSGIGVSVLNQRENFTHYNFTQINLDYAYSVQLTDDLTFRPAIEVGMGSKSYSFQNLIFEDQIDIAQGNINSGITESSNWNEKINFFDFSAGMLFSSDNILFGMALKHLNKPNISLVSNGNIPLGFFFTANLSYEFKIADYADIILFPYETRLRLNSNYMSQGDYKRFDIGPSFIFPNFFLGISANTNPDKKAILNSINMYGGLRYEHMQFGYSYDLSTHKFGNTSSSYELSVLYQFDLYAKCKSCPKG